MFDCESRFATFFLRIRTLNCKHAAWLCGCSEDNWCLPTKRAYICKRVVGIIHSVAIYEL